MTLFLLLLLDLVLLVVTTKVATSVHAMRRARERSAAFNAAEAGFSHAVQMLAAGELHPGDEIEQGLGTASFRVEVVHVDTDHGWRILELRSTGRSGRLAQPLVLAIAAKPSQGGEPGFELAFVEWRQLKLESR